MTKPTVIEQIPLKLLEEFPNHPYKVLYNEDMATLVQSILEHGITSPLILWEREPDVYIVISGHRRGIACEIINESGEAFIETVPALVYRDITLEEATVIMVDENARREKLLPSEKARAYRMKLEAMRRQGKRTDLTSTQVVSKLKSGESTTSTPMARKLRENATIIGEQAGESGDQVRRYIRLTYLISELLDMVDSGEIGFRSAVEISYLSEPEQRTLLAEIKSRGIVPNLKQALSLKAASKDKEFDDNVVDILTEVRLDDRVTFRLHPGQLQQLDNTSLGTSLSRSELLRAYTATGGAVYVGRETVGELADVHADIARVGNLLKMQQNRLDEIAQNPFLVESDRELLSAAIADTKELREQLDVLRETMRNVVKKINKNVDAMNSGKPKAQI